MNNDKCILMVSPLGMYSMLREPYVISILNDNGSLNQDKLNAMLATIANMGANALRDFTWIDSDDAYCKLSPFWRYADGSIEFNGLYFEHQRKIAELCNRYNIRYYLSIFDHCGTKRRTNARYSNPWRRFDDFFYGTDVTELRHNYVDRILDAFIGLDAGLEICNEPREGTGKFLAETFVYLIQKGFKPQNIILGIDYRLKEKNAAVGNDYRTLRETAIDKLGDRSWAKKLKTECISPVHNATWENIKDMWGPNVRPGGDRRILYSFDGLQKPRPTVNDAYLIAKKVLKTKNRARRKGKVHFEVVYGKTCNDPLDTMNGLSEAYKEIWKEYPANYGMYPHPLPLGDKESGPSVTVPLSVEERLTKLENDMADIKAKVGR